MGLMGGCVDLVGGSVVVFGVTAELDSVNRKLMADVRLLNLRELLI